jgi:hypothetical protein
VQKRKQTTMSALASDRNRNSRLTSLGRSLEGTTSRTNLQADIFIRNDRGCGGGRSLPHGSAAALQKAVRIVRPAHAARSLRLEERGQQWSFRPSSDACHACATWPMRRWESRTNSPARPTRSHGDSQHAGGSRALPNLAMPYGEVLPKSCDSPSAWPCAIVPRETHTHALSTRAPVV